MTKILILEKENIKEEIVDNIDNIFKKCKFKKMEDFVEIEKWQYDQLTIKLLGKIKGKTTNKNIHNIKNQEIIVYGLSALIAMKNNIFIDLNKELWNKFLDYNENKELNLENSENIILNDDVEEEEDDDDEDDDDDDKESDEGEKENQDKEDIENKDDDQEDLDEADEEDDQMFDSEEEIEVNKDKNQEKLNIDIADDENNFSGSELAEEKYVYSSEED
jgi:hypothetical protein